jgi:xanthine dehydrogenase accessory factor
MNTPDDNFDQDRFDKNSFEPVNGHKLNWNQASLNLDQQGKAYVLVTIIGVSGSTPRNSGTKMVVSQNEIFDTIGGGHLEYKAVKKAKAFLLENKDCQSIEHFELGSQLGQCCGGNATLLFECFAANTIHVAVFGAGHVGQALIPILAGLPCHVTWVDNRAEQFPLHCDQYSNVTKLISDEPASEIASMPSNTLYVVMTHNHQLDFDISLNVLKREDFHYLGLIASDTKWRRFQHRYKHREIKPSLVDKMNCPIGLEQVVGKMPMEVAVSVAGQIIESYQTLLPEHDSSNQNSSNSRLANKGVAWKKIKQIFSEQVQTEQISTEKVSTENTKAQQSIINKEVHTKNKSEDFAVMNDELLVKSGVRK